VFVQVSHDFSNSRGLALQEEQDIVFRGAAVPGEPAPQPVVAESGAPWQREVRPDEVLLFRYSALTFNGHRIHYDRAYATREECYPGLVVHGPLIATLLADLVRRQLPGAQFMAFDFKAHRPLFDGRPFTLNGAPAEDGRTVRLWTADHEGHLAMRASATLA
jgi:3-methylfumaryl-CoA hydratase